MSEIAERLCEALPAEPISVADVIALKKKVYPDIAPVLGINPEPKEDVIILHVTDDPTVSYLGVEASGWEIISSASSAEAPSPQATMKEVIEPAMEWAETYYSSETFALLEKGATHGRRETK